MNLELLRSIVGLSDRASRRQGAKRIAQMLGADDLIVFVRDSELDFMLPAFEFPQTLPDGRKWRELLTTALNVGRSQGELKFPDSKTICRAHLFRIGDSAALALCGGEPDEELIAEALEIFPLAAALFHDERAVSDSEGRARAAREAAAETQDLAKTLESTRTRLQRALAEAEGANRAKDEFLAVVSHELRTPLNAMLGWAHLIQSGALEKDEIDGALTTIERNARAQAALINDILDFARIVTGKLRISRKPADLAAISETVRNNMRPAADAKNIKLSLKRSHGNTVINGDAERLQQIIWNLLSNAIKFTPDEGEVSIEIASTINHVSVIVRDSGIGIKKEFLPYVFERFRQADSTTTRRHGGLGLGLSIVKHLVELHGGYIRAESDGKGMGSRFFVDLPVGSATPQSPESDPAKANATAVTADSATVIGRLRGVRVLVLDDDADARVLLGAILDQAGAEARMASTADEAFSLVQEFHPDVLVSDIAMPGEDGYTFIHRVRALPKDLGGETLAIALTAHARSTDRAKSLAAGFQLHLTKPLEPAIFASMVSSLISDERLTVESKANQAG